MLDLSRGPTRNLQPQTTPQTMKLQTHETPRETLNTVTAASGSGPASEDCPGMPARRVHWRSRGWIATTVAAITMILAPAGLLSVRGQDRFIAYLVPAGTTGNQNFGGVLGMDFDVQNPVLITKLGVFDDGSDGLNLTLIARLWDRATQTELAAVEFTPEDPGELIGGQPLQAAAGAHSAGDRLSRHDHCRGLRGHGTVAKWLR